MTATLTQNNYRYYYEEGEGQDYPIYCDYDDCCKEIVDFNGSTVRRSFTCKCHGFEFCNRCYREVRGDHKWD